MIEGMSARVLQAPGAWPPIGRIGDVQQLDQFPTSVNERWRSVVGFEGLYEVSDFGRVRSVPRTVRNHRNGKVLEWRLPGKIISPGVDKTTGRKLVILYRDHKARQKRRLMLEAFVGPCPLNAEACHCDGNPGNDKLNNLRWPPR